MDQPKYDQTNASIPSGQSKNEFHFKDSSNVVIGQDRSQIYYGGFFQNFIYTSGNEPVSAKTLSILLIEYLVCICLPYIALVYLETERFVLTLFSSFITDLDMGSDSFAWLQVAFFLLTCFLIACLTSRPGVYLYSLMMGFAWAATVFLLLATIHLPFALIFVGAVVVYLYSLSLHFKIFGLKKIVNVKDPDQIWQWLRQKTKGAVDHGR
ncbi:hypothetical protein [Thermoflavimicrobium dichotomicum]|uniref:Uncharacterized protein n=1 Tax=Thermoflavimicrobium dichotomicum TaxID=46223 RepID=A0A1I3RXY4_9BACL|nr:hypothetical protein [Thermoflavimicrobium dichotomicum]SFJ51198.1 hypothetical protein SAMN05421852_11176 [Thermoflavimicrobium dichotomicum]